MRNANESERPRVKRTQRVHTKAEIDSGNMRESERDINRERRREREKERERKRERERRVRANYNC